MTSLRDLIQEQTELDPADMRHLIRLAADWHILADLSFADLLLWVPVGVGSLLCVAQVRPATAPTVYQDDQVGRLASDADMEHLGLVLRDGQVWRQSDPAWHGGMPARRDAFPIRRSASATVLGIVGRDTNLSTARTPSQLELNYLSVADDLTDMVADGSFPPVKDRRDTTTLRVGDGLMRVDAAGKVAYASPNAQSAFRRIGLTSGLVGVDLATTVAAVAEDRHLGQGASTEIAAAVHGQAGAQGTIAARGSVVRWRAIPLFSAGTAAGAAVLVRDATEPDEDVLSDLVASTGSDVSAGLGDSAAEPGISPYAGYSADSVNARDSLGIDDDVFALAALVASNRTEPPLSIGLFGDWGSGKSFFMSRLRQRVTRLAEATQAARAQTPPQQSYFHQHVVQVSFNAWHYVDANLWASLVTRVFESLNEYVQELERKVGAAYRDLFTELETSQALLADTQRRQDQARAALRRAEQRRQSAALNRASSRTLADLAVNHPELADEVGLLGDTLGLDGDTTHMAEVRAVSQDLQGVGGLLRRRWTALRRPHGRRGWSRRRLLMVLAALGAATVAGMVVLLQVDQSAAAIIASVAALLAGATTSVKVLFADTRDALRAAERVLAAENRDEAKALRAFEQDVGAARERVRSLEDELVRLREMEPSNLYRFIHDRYTSTDYRQHLGVVALIERDLRTLSDLLVPSGRRRQKSREGLPEIDRIVLYIDDLDRCPPHKVVQVLQAVHLLLAFPLFVVVVGVDSRWLVRSLEHEYETILKPSQGSNGKASHERDELASTPQNYLEKIFQIPFWLQPMQPSGFGQLVRSLMDEQAVSVMDEQAVSPLDEQSVRERIPAAPADAPPQPEASPPQPPSAVTGQPGEATVSPVEPTRQSDSRPVDLAPPTLRFTEREAAFAEQLAPLIPTPRAAKRFINLYRLLKSRLHDDEIPSFHGGGTGEPGQHEAVLVLLAIMVGSPGHAQAVFDRLDTTPAATWADFATAFGETPLPDEAAKSDPAWQQFCRDIADLAWVTEAEVAVLQRWAERVSRYSFDGPGRPRRHRPRSSAHGPGPSAANGQRTTMATNDQSSDLDHR